MENNVKTKILPGQMLRRSARSGIATKISLLILLAAASNGYALCGMFSGAPLTQQPVNASGAIEK
jgi:hypothetical protein